MAAEKSRNSTSEIIIPIRLKPRFIGTNYILLFLLFFNLIFSLVIYLRQEHFYQTNEYYHFIHNLDDFKFVPSIRSRPITYSFDLITTNLAKMDTPIRYIRVKPILILKENPPFNEIEIKNGIIKHEIIKYFNKLKPREALKVESFYKIKKDLLKIFKKTLTRTQLELIYFSEFRIN